MMFSTLLAWAYIWAAGDPAVCIANEQPLFLWHRTTVIHVGCLEAAAWCCFFFARCCRARHFHPPERPAPPCSSHGSPPQVPLRSLLFRSPSNPAQARWMSATQQIIRLRRLRRMWAHIGHLLNQPHVRAIAPPARRKASRHSGSAGLFTGSSSMPPTGAELRAHVSFNAFLQQLGTRSSD